MKFKDLIYLNLILTFNPYVDSLNIFQSLRREIRFTRFDFQYINKSFGIVLESAIKPLPQHKQAVNVHTIVYEKISKLFMQVGVYKCKEFYVDCINVITYDIDDICSKLDALSYFWKSENSEETIQKCPIFGEYYYKNVTIDGDKFVSLFSLPTENWLEYTWRITILAQRSDKSHFSQCLVDFYALQFRNRNQKP